MSKILNLQKRVVEAPPDSISNHLPNSDTFIQFLQKNNPRQEPVTIDRLRSYPGCEHYNDDQAAEILDLLNQLALIVLGLEGQKETTCIDNQQVVHLDQDDGQDCVPISSTQNKAA